MSLERTPKRVSRRASALRCGFVDQPCDWPALRGMRLERILGANKVAIIALRVVGSGQQRFTL